MIKQMRVKNQATHKDVRESARQHVIKLHFISIRRNGQ